MAGIFFQFSANNTVKPEVKQQTKNDADTNV